MFVNRMDAALRLAKKLTPYKGKNVLVLGIPRGGVETAYYIAAYLEAELSVLVVRKLGHPANKECAFGAIAEDGTVYYNPGALKGISQEAIDEAEDRGQDEIRERIKRFRKGRSLPHLKDRTIIVADDGIATGATILCAIKICRHHNARRIIVAAPVSDLATKKALQLEADEVIIPETPADFYAVSQAYGSFHDLSDKETIAFLERWDKEHKKMEM